MKSNLSRRDQNVIWHPYSPLMATPPIPVLRAEREMIYTEDGSELIDLISSWWVNIHGHCHPHIQERVSAQLRELDHIIFAGFTHEPAVRLAERLLAKLPQGQERIFYSDNGSTAVEVALKMSFQYWQNRGEQRKRIVVLDGSYHGDTVGAMSVSARGIFTRTFNDMLFDVEVLPRPYGDGEVFLRAVESVLQSDAPALFLFEPLIQGAGGMYIYSAEVLDRAIERFRSRQVLCIADEVMTGFCRTGRWFASDYLAHSPDLICLSKGITGGVLPLGVTACSARIAESFMTEDRSRTFFHGHSYTGNPLACAAALASMDLLESEECQAAVACISEAQQCAAISLAALKHVTEARALGTILAVSLEDEKAGYLSPLGSRLYDYFISRGCLIRPLGNVVYLMPPYCITRERLAYAHTVIADAVREILS